MRRRLDVEVAGCRVVRVPMTERFTLGLAAVQPDDAARARNIIVCSDECYVEFTWSGRPVGEVGLPASSVLSSGSDGVLALHSLSKRSNLAGGRIGLCAGDTALVAALADQIHVTEQRHRYWERLERLADAATQAGFVDVSLPAGGPNTSRSWGA